VRDLSGFPLVRPLANRFREVVSGSKDGRPDWVEKIAIGGDEGLFGENSAVWQIHGNVVTIIGGIRALLLQAAHPAPLNGVADHSRYESDPMGRLAGTTRWLTITTFASKEVIAKEAERVNAMHEKVRGSFKNKSGEIESYQAKNERYLLWVHTAFTDSFLKSYLAIGPAIRWESGYRSGKELADAYVNEWSESAVGLGLKSAPKSLAELEEVLDHFRERELTLNEKSEEVIKFILKPPFSFLGNVFYSILANAAIATLDERDRELLNLKKPASWNLALTKHLLQLLSAILGHKSPSEKIARDRIARIQRNSESVNR
jgi:uncharacterized protein (DUF2236 family)